MKVYIQEPTGKYWLAPAMGTTENIREAYAYDEENLPVHCDRERVTLVKAPKYEAMSGAVTGHDGKHVGDESGYQDFPTEPGKLIWLEPGVKIIPPREYTRDERKAMPVYSGCIKYFPDALAAVSRVSKKSNAKHNGPDAPLEWSRGKSTDQMDAALRHIMEPDAADADSGEIELAHAAWRILAQLQLAEEKRLREQGIKPFSGVIA